MKCKHVKKCWQLLNLEGVRLQLISPRSAREVVEVILQMKREERRLVICLLWAWWGSRNKANAGEVRQSADEVAHRAVTFANCSYQLESKPRRDVSYGRQAGRKWVPPPPDVLKINMDGAFREGDKT